MLVRKLVELVILYPRSTCIDHPIATTNWITRTDRNYVESPMNLLKKKIKITVTETKYEPKSSQKLCTMSWLKATVSTKRRARSTSASVKTDLQRWIVERKSEQNGSGNWLKYCTKIYLENFMIMVHHHLKNTTSENLYNGSPTSFDWILTQRVQSHWAWDCLMTT